MELFSRTGRTYYGFQILIRSKEEDEDDEEMKCRGLPILFPLSDREPQQGSSHSREQGFDNVESLGRGRGGV